MDQSPVNVTYTQSHVLQSEGQERYKEQLHKMKTSTKVIWFLKNFEVRSFINKPEMLKTFEVLCTHGKSTKHHCQQLETQVRAVWSKSHGARALCYYH